MKSAFIMQASLLDILFENRNKQYGAYSLRKNYTKEMHKALLLVFAFAAIIFWLSQKQPHKTLPHVFSVPDPGFAEYVIKEKPFLPEKPQVSTAASLPKKGTQQTKNIIITNENVKPISNEEGIETGSTDEILNVGPTLVTPGNNPPAEIISVPVIKETIIDKETPLHIAEQMPAYPGGLSALRKFLLANLSNPEDLEMDETRTVKIKFVVGYDGALKSFEIVEDGGKAFNKEVIRVLKKMPDWIPGKSRGQNVSVFFVLPVKFSASE